MFSKACEYGLRAAIYIAEQSIQDRKVSLREIAACIDSPEPFTAKILQQLSRSKLINSEKGPSGGFSMDAEKLRSVYLSHIVAAIDGDAIYKGCGLGLKACNEALPCPLHTHFKSIRNQLRKMLESNTVHALALQLKDGAAVLRLEDINLYTPEEEKPDSKA